MTEEASGMGQAKERNRKTREEPAFFFFNKGVLCIPTKRALSSSCQDP